MPLYHLTTGSAIDAILAEGLKPQIGARSKLCGEALPAVYLFKDLNAVENALLNWFGETADEDDTIALIEVDGAGLQLDDGADYEVVCKSVIGPQKLCLSIANVDDLVAWQSLRNSSPAQ